jgi:hypothetical protein
VTGLSVFVFVAVVVGVVCPVFFRFLRLFCFLPLPREKNLPATAAGRPQTCRGINGSFGGITLL